MKYLNIGHLKTAGIFIVKSLKKFLNIFLNILYPHRCPSCLTMVSDDVFCSSCWKKLYFIEKPYCTICGEPLVATNEGDGLSCAACLRNRPYFNRNISIFVYNRTIIRVVYRLKYNQKLFLAKFLAKFLVKRLEEVDNTVKLDYITMVPLHPKRFRMRGYNQSLLLARELSKIKHIPCIDDLLIKQKNTIPQTKLDRKRRKTNLKSVFVTNEKWLGDIKGKNIGVVDDVFTTGSTLNECAKTLKKAGVARVFTFTLVKTTLNMALKRQAEGDIVCKNMGHKNYKYYKYNK